ncbi:MAG: amylo-alpha-1,6-glucosidase [Flammeovirgaceae bacterium]|nr:amylo-alpha-1,6-glucosidase [Flammeovirgaceae bacterium]
MLKYMLFFACQFLVVFFMGCRQKKILENTISPTILPDRIQEMGIVVKPEENRQYSYTDKETAYYYGRTHTDRFNDYFAGWNINRQRILKDYTLLVDETSLERKNASVTVFPHQLVRVFEQVREEFSLFDQKKVLSIALKEIKGIKIGIALFGELVFEKISDNIAFFRHKELPNTWVGVTVRKPVAVLEEQRIAETIYCRTDTAAQGFFIASDSVEENIKELLSEAQNYHEEWASYRKERMNKLIGEQSVVSTSDSALTLALRWTNLTLDQLITKQTGYGIYAGLPWFNDYWGRDTFISLAGACLVTGQHEVARKILISFSDYQNADEKSPYYGRVPNRLRPDEVIYNTADGTPRFVIALRKYIEYSGDQEIIPLLYVTVKRALDGGLKNWVDEKGYLKHEDADTWMDAKIDGKIPWSARGSRACDVQALWYEALNVGVFFAQVFQKEDDAIRWKNAAQQLKQHFEKDFWQDGKHGFLADRLTWNEQPDFTFRPNQLFALDLLSSDSLRWVCTRNVCENLVFPWGVSSLWQEDENFHPYHEYWEFYHKDAAYHNGTVWLWNSGIAIQRLLEAYQKQHAYLLFKNMSLLPLRIGAVGSIAENMDAHPVGKATFPRLTGTFLQAWSNAEFLRVWHEEFWGIKPNAIDNRLVLFPQLPEELDSVEITVSLMQGKMQGSYRKMAGKRWYKFMFQDISPQVVFKQEGFASVEIPTVEDAVLTVEVEDGIISVGLYDDSQNQLISYRLEEDKKQLAHLALARRLFEKFSFAQPVLKKGLKSVKEKDFLRKKLEKEWIAEHPIE